MTSDRQPPNRSPLAALIAAIVALLFLVAVLGTAFVLVSGRSPLSVLLEQIDNYDGVASPSVDNDGGPSTAQQISEAVGIAAPTETATTQPSPSATATPAPTDTPMPTVTPTETPSPTPTATPARPEAAVEADRLNVRAGPGTVFAVLDQVGAGDRLLVTGRDEDGDWIQVCCVGDGDEPGWVSTQFVDMTTEASLIPTVEAPPTPEPTPTTEAAPIVSPAGSANVRAAELARPAQGLLGPGGFGAPGSTNPLTGLELPLGRAGQRPLIVCINNDFAARPQFGTSQADLMYEYLMEGYSITRFSGVYYGEESAQIGPIRSARLINYYMGALFDAGLACSGASDAVRFLLKNSAPFPYLDVDLDDPSNSLYTSSVGSDYRTRLRTSSAGLRRWMSATGAERSPSLRGMLFGEVPDGGAPAGTINIPYPSVTGSQVSYRFENASGRYLRFLGGAPHLDGNSGAQLALDNVIVQYVPHETTDIIEDSLGSRSIRLNLFGSGGAILFRNGIAFEGSWRSDSQGDLPRFFDSTGREIPLKPGRTWINIVPLTYTISYQ